MTNNVKFPEFQKENIQSFFTLCEIYFEHSNIQNEIEKFRMLSLSLPTDTIQSVNALISNPSRATPYSDLKTSLISEFSKSNFSRFHMLLHEVLFEGSCKQLYSKIEEYSKGFGINEDTLKAFFVARLPNQLRLQLNLLPDNLSIKKIISKLDTAYSIIQDEGKSSSLSDNKFNTLEAKLDILSSKLNNFNKDRFDYQINNTPHVRNFPNTKNIQFYEKQNHFPNLQSQQNICYYHSRFGNRAFKCIAPCNFPKN